MTLLWTAMTRTTHKNIQRGQAFGPAAQPTVEISTTYTGLSELIAVSVIMLKQISEVTSDDSSNRLPETHKRNQRKQARHVNAATRKTHTGSLAADNGAMHLQASEGSQSLYLKLGIVGGVSELETKSKIGKD